MIHTFKVASTLAAQRIVAMTSTAYTVGYPADAKALPLGITKDNVKDTTTGVPVACVGERAKLYMNETMAAGGLVGSDTSGRGIPRTLVAQTTSAASTTVAYVGVLLGPAVALTGTIGEILIQPGFVIGT